jgi:hypothetical protein
VFIKDNNNYIIGIVDSKDYLLPKEIKLDTRTGEFPWDVYTYEDTSSSPPLSEISDGGIVHTLFNKRKLSGTLMIEYQYIDQCNMPKKSKEVYKLICERITAANISFITRKEISSSLNIDRFVLSKALSSIPKTMLIEQKEKWLVSPLYAFKGHPSFKVAMINNWIHHITISKLHVNKGA